MRSVPPCRTAPLRRAIALLAAVAVAVPLLTGCASTGASSKKKTPKTKVKVGTESMTTADVKVATFGVTWSNPDRVIKEGTTKVSYVMREGKESILGTENHAVGWDDSTIATSERVAQVSRWSNVRNYVLMGPIVAVIGESRSFEVGKTYDGTMLGPNGKPQFRYTCDRQQEVAGISGYHVNVVGAKEGKTEFEAVLSPNFPFPLLLKEHTGQDPVQIFLKESK